MHSSCALRSVHPGSDIIASEPSESHPVSDSMHRTRLRSACVTVRGTPLLSRPV